MDAAWLMKESLPGQFSQGMCQWPKLELIDPRLDFALLKVDFARNSSKAHLRGQTGFPHIVVSTRALEEGEPVYSFGYPLPEVRIVTKNPQITIGHTGYSPRTTSAIVASTMDRQAMFSTSADPRVYVLDKALNYGNSGGPIVAVDTGHVHALCSRFQPVSIQQPHITNKDGQSLSITIPSLYGVVSSLHNPQIVSYLKERGVPLSDR
jgi:serine protease Do